MSDKYDTPQNSDHPLSIDLRIIQSFLGLNTMHGVIEYQRNDKQAADPAIEEAILFGSRVMGTYKKASDVDIVLKGEQIDWTLAAKLKDHLRRRNASAFFFDVIAIPPA